MKDFEKKKNSKKQKAGAAGGHAKASAAKKPRTDTNAVLAPEAERALSQALLRVPRCPAWSRVRVAHAHPLRLRLSPLARASVVLLLPIVTIVAIAFSLCMRDLNRVVAGTLHWSSMPLERRVGSEI